MTRILPSELLKEYYQVIENLKNSEIIWSDNHDGNIGEFIASRIFNVILEENQRAPHFDGFLNGERVQIKYSNSTQRTNIKVGNPRQYDRLILILHSNSNQFPDTGTSDFVAYNLNSENVISSFTETSNATFTCTKNQLSELVFQNICFENLDPTATAEDDT